MRIVRLLSGFVAAVSLVAVPVRAQSVPPPPAATPWYWQNPLPHGNPLSAASCPDATTCYAVGSATTEVSHARGQWSVNLDKSLGALTALSCPDSATCFALSNVGPNVGAILGTTDGGQMWTRLRPAGSTPLTLISCPSPAVCYVTAQYTGQVVLTTDGGHTWSSVKIGFRPVDLACPSTTVCYAPIDTSLVNSPPPSVAVSTNGGKTWVRHAVGVQGQLWSIRCVSASACYLIAFTGPDLGVPLLLRTSNGGLTWTRRSFPSGTYFRGGSFTCPTVGTCYLAGDNGTAPGILLATNDAGLTWIRRKPPPGRPSALACKSRLACVGVGVGGNIESTVDGWATWSEETRNVVRGLANPQSGYGLRSVACPSSTVCYAAGDRSAFAVTSDAGMHWRNNTAGLKRQHIVLNFSTLGCATTTTCFAGSVAQYPPGSGSQVVSTRDGGKTWAANPGKGYAVVACPTTSVCYAGGEKGAMRVSRNAGRTWTTVRTPLTGKRYTILQIACPAAGTCYAGAVGPSEPPPHPESNVGALITTTNGGKTWTRTNTDPYPVTLACRTSTDCFALLVNTFAAKNLVTHDAGRTWVPYTALPSAAWSSMTCVDSETCYVAGPSGTIEVTRDGGTSWSVDPTPTFNSLSSIACTGQQGCFAVGAFGTILARGSTAQTSSFRSARYTTT